MSGREGALVPAVGAECDRPLQWHRPQPREWPCHPQGNEERSAPGPIRPPEARHHPVASRALALDRSHPRARGQPRGRAAQEEGYLDGNGSAQDQTLEPSSAGRMEQGSGG